MNLESTTRLQEDINKLTGLKRNHFLPGTEQKEDDASHSYSVAMIAWKLHNELAPQLKLEIIMQYAMIHDFVEIHAGDVNTFAPQEAKLQKVINERAALEQLAAEYAQWPQFVDTLRRYEAKEDEESRFVWSCDKIQALLQGQLDEWRCYYEFPISDETFAAKLKEFQPDIHPALAEFFATLTEGCIDSYHNPRID